PYLIDERSRRLPLRTINAASIFKSPRAAVINSGLCKGGGIIKRRAKKEKDFPASTRERVAFSEHRTRPHAFGRRPTDLLECHHRLGVSITHYIATIR